MNRNIDYYRVLGLSNTSSDKAIRKAYRELSKIYHPDRGGDVESFGVIKEAYDTLSGEDKVKYDRLSVYGKNYDRLSEMLSNDIDKVMSEYNHTEYKKVRDSERLNVVEYVDDTFDGTIAYNRYVMCKTCGGTGKDFDSTLEITDSNGKVIATYDGYDGCDFCEGTGKDSRSGGECRFCFGAGKVGESNCSDCNGDKRILGKQRLSNIKLSTDEIRTVVKCMGNSSKLMPGKVGDLIIIKKDEE